MRTLSRLRGLALVTLMVGALLFVLLAEGCSTTPAFQPTSGTSATETRPYGSLTFANNFGENLDPLLDGAVGFRTMGSAVFDTLWYWDVDDFELRPGIAERWQIAPDGMSHTFYIRKGVKFHDGTDLTAADVKFSIERMIGPKSTSNVGVPIWRPAIASVEVKDDYTV
ncbi:MAG: ABC transporter substrate-binding protein, partial [Dehalococcoidia bacterium]|nr:ABC transporter substrate-binding protein [Dehalococcoidia bacterium]